MSKPDLQLVNTQAHKHLKIQSTKYNVSENQINATIVVAGELSALVHEYPIFITRSQQGAPYQLTALLGLHSGENLFLQGDTWRANYLPLDILRRPFQAFIPDPSHPTKGSIAIDLNSELVSETDGETLFLENGDATDYFKRIETTFSQLMGGNTFTAELLEKAADLGLLEQVNLNFDLPNGQKANLNGLFVFNKEAVSALSGEALEQCHQLGLLQVCHLVLSSSIHLDKLIKWSGEK